MLKTASQRVASGASTEAASACMRNTSHAAAALAIALGAHRLLFLQRRHRALGMSGCGEAAGPYFQALQCGRAFVKSRSLSPDDPFGERSSWEDPSDGIYSAWKDVDQEGFVKAADSREVREAHFGPEWARFSTVGRMSVKKMRADQKLHHAPQSEAAGGEPQGAGVAVAASGSSTERYPTTEELHEADLRQRRRLLERNYSSYEAFVEHEIGGGDGFAGTNEDLTSVSEARMHRSGAKAELYSAASMESAFSAVGGLDGRDRMTQRNVEREALETLEAAEVAERVPLPSFMFDPDIRDDATTSALSLTNPIPTITSASTAAEISRSTAATSFFAEEPCSTTNSSSELTVPSVSATAGGTPANVVRQVLGVLGSPHGDSRLPLTDPMEWGTEDIILFLTLMEKPSRSVEAGSLPALSACSTMDDAMCGTFRMARVTGETLLNVVVPPRLFRLMRQWHVRRQDVVNKAWKLHGQAMRTPATATDGHLPGDIVQTAVLQGCERLEEVVQQLDCTLIQETILLCFPYGH
ncbi:hypothetical protein LPMP_332430 [Leishmania panamensis]|uniref:Uncharacterized protein n=1 Tax=Leishmania panamensis TaxID=5679 RepID=A0A088S1U0_LEIPA|nr:hypothetical protein LPMP_332430 [Leishmania panamensis]AIO01535.1 hypothetical protein LPMP_332430 [Leishmania panamensis]